MRPAPNAAVWHWIAWALVPGLGAAQPAASPAWPNATDLAAGDVAVRVDDDGRFRGHIELAVLVEASAERIFEILRDCARSPEYVPHVQSCERVEVLEAGRAEVFRQRIRYTWFLPAFDHVFRLDYEPYSAVTVARVEGPLARLDGRWTLEERGDGKTLLMYVLDFAPGMPVPRFLVGRAVLRDLPEVLRAIRRRAEQS